jgi:hypothetical protein
MGWESTWNIDIMCYYHFSEPVVCNSLVLGHLGKEKLTYIRTNATRKAWATSSVAPRISAPVGGYNSSERILLRIRDVK